MNRDLCCYWDETKSASVLYNDVIALFHLNAFK